MHDVMQAYLIFIGSTLFFFVWLVCITMPFSSFYNSFNLQVDGRWCN